MRLGALHTFHIPEAAGVRSYRRPGNDQWFGTLPRSVREVRGPPAERFRQNSAESGCRTCSRKGSQCSMPTRSEGWNARNALFSTEIRLRNDGLARTRAPRPDSACQQEWSLVRRLFSPSNNTLYLQGCFSFVLLFPSSPCVGGLRLQRELELMQEKAWLELPDTSSKVSNRGSP